MKPYARELKAGYVGKLSTSPHPQINYYTPKKKSPSGHEIHDPTAGLNSRPRYKQMIRNARRAQNKRARQRLKKEMEILI